MKKVSGTTGRFIPCCWWDCTRDGNDTYQLVLLEGAPPRNLIYLFCSERHLELWRHSKHSAGNLPVGLRGLLLPGR